MNCVGVTCLRTVIPSGLGASSPPYLAETDFQVPISLLSDFAPPLGSSPRPTAATNTKAVATARNRATIVVMMILRVVGKSTERRRFLIAIGILAWRNGEASEIQFPLFQPFVECR